VTVAPAAASDLAKLPRSYRGRAFGIEVIASIPLPLSSERAAAVGPRRTELLRASWRELADAFPTSRPTTVLERRLADGSLVMSVGHDVDCGYCVYAPRNGRHLVSPDGRRIVSYLPRISPWRWQRLLLAQVLPLAATLQGLELLHASAVEYDGRVFGFVARAGAGKTSTAAHLVALGGSLLTDDVLALERSDDGVIAHPGANTLHLDTRELARITAPGSDRLGSVLGGADKVMLAAPVAAQARRLDALYFLERHAPRDLSISPLEPDPIRLLANSFNGYVRSEERVLIQLEVAAALAESVAMFEVAVPARSTAADVAAAVAEHMRVTS
jgi:hypothetical protein